MILFGGFDVIARPVSNTMSVGDSVMLCVMTNL